MIPERLATFRFPGFGPDPGHGIAALTHDRRVVITDAPGNPGTSLTTSIEFAIPPALEALGIEGEVKGVFQWTPSDPLKPNSLWRVEVSSTLEPMWHQELDWDSDPGMRGAVKALRDAGGAARSSF